MIYHNMFKLGVTILHILRLYCRIMYKATFFGLFVNIPCKVNIRDTKNFKKGISDSIEPPLNSDRIVLFKMWIFFFISFHIWNFPISSTISICHFVTFVNFLFPPLLSFWWVYQITWANVAYDLIRLFAQVRKHWIQYSQFIEWETSRETSLVWEMKTATRK